MGFRQPLSSQASEHPSSDSLCPISVPMAAKDTAWSAGGPFFDTSLISNYETGDGISVQEEGFLKNPGVEGEEAQTARGTYSYTAPDGQVITVNWYADETGFHAEGAHIPSTSPPVLGPPVTVVPVGPLGPARPKPPDQNEPFEGVPIRPAAEFFRG
ncbi:endocuticle structural glycoprotein SgAbd-2 isoform X2 [Halyomorpha halys]|uniref:endocuticle structural glycoprotein SgAbd-2 isoform X2 n=1 Tax=Halyomorpha halys TaxID=286706 RepID=UPI0006D513F8|nr:endocuticle structural glycoprotein SgAbd-2-like isoform X2 [Halyomorpha halys]